MSFLDDVVTLRITLNSSAPTKAGFGRALFAGYHTHFPPGTLARLYKQPDEMLLDGFVAGDMLYKYAQAYKSQSPCPKDFYIGMLTVAPTQVIDITPVFTAAVINTYSGTVGGKAWTFSSDNTPTLAEICTGIASAQTAAAGGATATGASGTKVVSTTTAAGAVIDYTFTTNNMSVKDQTADAATPIATQLASIRTLVSDWYGLACVHEGGETVTNLVSAWTETQRILHVVCSADSGIIDVPTVSTTDLASDLHGLAYFRTVPFYHQDVGSRLHVAMMANRFVAVAGSDTWAHKRVRGVATSSLTTAQAAAAEGKKCNVYLTIAGNGDLLWGTVASGEYADQVRGIDALYARIQEAYAGLFQANEKVPFTPTGRGMMISTLEGVLHTFAREPINFLVDDDTLFVTAPLVSEVDASDKAARKYPDVRGNATLQGAVHMVEIAITLDS